MINWKHEGAPIDVPVTSDKFWLLTEKPALPLPSPFDNQGNYVISPHPKDSSSWSTRESFSETAQQEIVITAAASKNLVMSSSILLRALSHTWSIRQGKVIHCKLMVSGFGTDVHVNNHLILMYAKCGFFDDACHLFDHMPQKNAFSWTILISGYSSCGPPAEAITALRRMAAAGFNPDRRTYFNVLSACTSVRALRSGREIHARFYRLDEDVTSCFLSNLLVNMYAKCGMIHLAQRVFDEIIQPSLVSWCSIISGYSQCGDSLEALRLFLRAWEKGMKVNEFIIANVLGACSKLGYLMFGKQLHCHVVKSGNGYDPYVQAEILSIYVRCDELELAWKFFSELHEPGLASWVALIGGCIQEGKEQKAIALFRKLHYSGVKPNEHVLPLALVACSSMVSIDGGRQLHSLIIKLGFRMVAHVGNAVLDLYGKCGLMCESLKLFEEMEERDVVTWNSMIASHVNLNDYVGVVRLLKQMLRQGLEPDMYTYSSMLNLFADLPVIGWGQQIHNCVIKAELDKHTIIGTALIDMYAKCGNLKYARKVFDKLPVKNLVSWNSMLVGYAQNGFAREALEIFSMMQMGNVKPSDVTFIGILSACAHAGLVEQGQAFFDQMNENGIIARIDHFACMVDLFARSGQIEVAYDFIIDMPMKPNKVIWRSLLSGCRTHGDFRIGILAAKQILTLDPEDIAARVMLSNAYAQADMWDERSEMRDSMKSGLEKVPGWSRI